MRKGQGTGQGMGYKNLLIFDSMIHAQSRQGIKQPQYKGTYLRKIHNPDDLIATLKEKPLSNIYITKKHISFSIGSDRISNPIKYNTKVGNIANWGHSLPNKTIYIDKDAPYWKQLAVHEAVEQYVSEKYGLKYKEAHDIATLFEQKYAKMHNINWEKSQSEIFNTKI
jgi:hypothetical protein